MVNHTLNHTLDMNGTDTKPASSVLVPGVLVLLLAVPLALMIHLVNEAFAGRPERAVMIVGGLFAILSALPSVVYILVQRRSVEPWRLGLIIFATVGVLLVSIYLYWVSFYVFFPADFLIWSESDFVNDILKFRVGYPIYSAEANNESFHYVPGSRLLTYLLAWLTGNATSIPVYRMIQVGYVLLASVVGVLCCRKLVEMSLPGRRFCNWGLWSVVWLPLLFLAATNSLTNPFVHNLHDDALALLVSVVAFWLLLEYVAARNKYVLVLMAIVPGIGFLVKQSLAVWAVFYCLQLALFDRPRSIKRLAVFAPLAFGGIGTAVAGCYLLWGDHFIYWIFTVLREHDVSPLRSFQHVLDIWPYFVIGLLGGFVLLRDKSFNLLLGPWLIWLFLILIEAYTSGIAWMLNHIGPGCLIAGIWFLVALARVWPLGLGVTARKYSAKTWLRAGVGVIVVGLLFSGLGIIRIPIRPLPEDIYRYVSEIEREFEGQPAESILLDVGTWVYMEDGVVMKDRAPSIGERGYSETGDFSGIVGRLREKHYSKILVRKLHSPDFWYDYWLWDKSSGIRQALLENYHEVRMIKGITEIDGEGRPQPINYTFGDISILVPKPEGN